MCGYLVDGGCRLKTKAYPVKFWGPPVPVRSPGFSSPSLLNVPISTRSPCWPESHIFRIMFGQFALSWYSRNMSSDPRGRAGCAFSQSPGAGGSSSTSLLHQKNCQRTQFTHQTILQRQNNFDQTSLDNHVFRKSSVRPQLCRQDARWQNTHRMVAEAMVFPH